MTPPPNAVRHIGHNARFAEAIAQIDAELEYDSGAAVAARRDEVVAAARAAYGPTEDFRGIRDAWDAVFPDGVYSASGFAERRPRPRRTPRRASAAPATVGPHDRPTARQGGDRHGRR